MNTLHTSDLGVVVDTIVQLQPREGKNDKKIRGSIQIALQWEADIARRRRMEDALKEWNETWLAEAQAQGLHP